MGKKGKALREAKLRNTAYTFTREQLEAHDRQIRLECVEMCKLAAEEKANKAIALAAEELEERNQQFMKNLEAEWDERSERFCSADTGANLVEFTRLAVMIPARVLVERFGWKPVPPGKEQGDMRYKMARLHDYIAAELNDIVSDELKDIRKYAEEAEAITGITFKIVEE